MSEYATSQPGAVIRPEIVASKLQASDNLEYPELAEQISTNPRLVELLWYIQAASMRPGGLRKFTAELIGRMPERLGTRSMLRFGVPKGGKYDFEQCKAVWREIPSSHWRKLRPAAAFDLDFWLFNSMEYSVEEERREAKEDAEFERELTELNRDYFNQVVQDTAMNELHAHLASICNEKNKLFCGPWYFPDLIEALVQYMEEHARQASASLAKTEVVLKVFDALDYAFGKAREWVRIEGNSLFGKSESVAAWCAGRPGIARLVKVPPLDCDSDLFRAIATALGMETSYSASGSDLRRVIEFVLKHARLGLVFDEAHRLVPQKLSPTTVPTRLEWIRSTLAEQKVPCVLVVTPDSYGTSVSKFLKKTRYAFQQIDGRMFTVELPIKLNVRDLMAVARLHFPDVPEECLGVLATRAGKSKSYLKDVEHVAKRARYLADKAGRRVAMEDIDSACAEIMPQTVPARRPAPVKPARRSDPLPSAPAVQASRNSIAGPLQGVTDRLNEPELETVRNRFAAPIEAAVSR